MEQSTRPASPPESRSLSAPLSSPTSSPRTKTPAALHPEPPSRGVDAVAGVLLLRRAGPPPSPLLRLRCRHLLLLAGLSTRLLLRPPSPLAAGRPLLAPPSSSVLPPLATSAGPSPLRLPPPSYSLLPPRVTPPSPSCSLHFDLVG